MTSKEKRDQLFRKSRPLIRQVQIYEDDKYHKDIGILWAAYSERPFYDFPKELTQKEFVSRIEEITQQIDWMFAEDKTVAFESLFGPVALIAVSTDGWRIEPHTIFFPWATARNKLRVSISFFQMARYKKIGVCIVRCLENSVTLFNHCRDYGVLHYVGKIVNGDPRGDEYVYSVRGKKEPINV